MSFLLCEMTLISREKRGEEEDSLRIPSQSIVLVSFVLRKIPFFDLFSHVPAVRALLPTYVGRVHAGHLGGVTHRATLLSRSHKRAQSTVLKTTHVCGDSKTFCAEGDGFFGPNDTCGPSRLPLNNSIWQKAGFAKHPCTAQ